MLNTNVCLICLDSDDVASMKDSQFFRGFQIFCGSQCATLLPTSPLVTPILEYWPLVDTFCELALVEIVLISVILSEI